MFQAISDWLVYGNPGVPLGRALHFFIMERWRTPTACRT
jgi:hypothetical protein